jgi:hypothetical protein
LGTAAATILGIIPMVFCLKEVSGKKKKDSNEEEKRKTGEILRDACTYLRKEPRLRMAFLGNCVGMGAFFVVNLFGTNIYYQQGRPEVFAELSFAMVWVNYVLIAGLGLILQRSTEQNNYDLKTQLI